MTEYILESHGLGKKYGKRWVVNNVSLVMERGSAMAVLGPNGAGKTTSISLFLDMLRPTVGESSVFGLHSQREGVAIRKRVGYVPERPRMIGWMTVEKIMRFVASYYETWDWNYAEELQLQFNLDLQSKVRNLSQGEEAKLSFLLALSHQPELLIIDDATSGLDVNCRRELIDGIIRHMHDKGASVLFATHLIHEVEGLVDSVAFMSEGKLLDIAAVDELKASYKKISLFNSAGGAIPSPPDDAEVLEEQRSPREASWIVSNYNHIHWQQFSGDSEVRIEDLTLEEIYCARFRKPAGK